MRWQHVEELRADPGIAPAERNTPAGKRRSIWPAITVVAAAIAFGGVIWFAYQSGRDSSDSGTPPLIKADQGPVKVKPDQPGGQEIPFQDSTVYDRLGGPAQQKPVMEKLLPPPETPVQRAPAPQAPAASEAGPAQASTAQGDASAPAALAPKPAPPALAGPPAPAVAQSQPQPDPIGALAAASMPPKPPSTTLAANPAPSIGGTYRIQIGAVKTVDAVAVEWARLKHRFPETLSALKVSSDKVEVGSKGTFFRIQAGPLDERGAKSACDHLKAQGVGCIVVKS